MLVSLAPDRVPIVLALNAACIYIGAALGSAVGGLAKTLGGTPALAVAGGVAAAVALAHLLMSLRVNRT
jgi:predicted MFS family arabinose efflux permease